MMEYVLFIIERSAEPMWQLAISCDASRDIQDVGRRVAASQYRATYSSTLWALAFATSEDSHMDLS